jgi:hypothetical protein
MSKSIEQLDELEKLLEEYNDNSGLSITIDLEKINEYLNISIDEIQVLGAEQCFELAAQIGQHAVALQKLVNKESCRIKWCDKVINSMCAKEWDSYDKYMKADIKIEIIAQNNEAIQKVLKLKNNADLRKEKLFNMVNLIKYYSEVMIEGCRVKRKVSYGS